MILSMVAWLVVRNNYERMVDNAYIRQKFGK